VAICLKPEWVQPTSGNAFRMGEKLPLGTARGGRGSFPFFVIARER